MPYITQNPSVRHDYEPASPPIEQAMTLFVSWARANNRRYVGSLVKENLARDLAYGASPEQAVRNLLARVPR